MSLGWLGAIAAYGTAWYLGRRNERQHATALPAAGN
jgi:hypothetical protein